MWKKEREKMKLKQIVLFFLIWLLTTNYAHAFQNCQLKYDNDKRSLPSLRGNCGICHINPAGGGARTAFGQAFADAGFKITDDLVIRFPDLFQKQSGTGPPVIKRIKPSSVKANVQFMISIMGKNFIDGSKAIIDNNEVLTTFKSKFMLIADFILNTVGVHELKVKNPDGQESNTVNIKAK